MAFGYKSKPEGGGGGEWADRVGSDEGRTENGENFN